MKTWQKIAIALVASFAIFGLLAVVTILAALPDPAALGAMLRVTDRTQPEPAANQPTNARPTQKPKTVSSATNSQPPTAFVPPLDPAERRQQITARFVDRYFTEDRMQTRVCENLGSRVSPFRNVNEFGKQLEASLLGESARSPIVEAVMLPVEYTLKNEAVRDLVSMAKDAALRGDTGFLGKAEFYAQAALATASVLSSREEFEAVSSHGYRLYALSRAATLKPDVLQDAEATDLCRGMEEAALAGLERDETFDQERLDRVLSRYGIDPSDIGYDPRLSTRVQLEAGESGINVRVPWIEHILKK